MQSIGIGEIQKNISILTNLSEAMEIIDKRKKECVAVIYPVNTKSMISKLAGKYKARVPKIENLSMVKEEAMSLALREKYGLSD